MYRRSRSNGQMNSSPDKDGRQILLHPSDVKQRLVEMALEGFAQVTDMGIVA